MHLLYVDESGDTGRAGSRTRTFTLSGLLVHHADWHDAQSTIARMRQRLAKQYGFPVQAEIHASEMLGRSESLHGAQRYQRVQAALHAVEMIRREKRLTPLRVVAIKGELRQDIPQAAWLALLKATSHHITASEGHRFCSAHGLAIVCDDHRTAPSAAWLNHIRTQMELSNLLIDEPFGRDSRQSPMLQLCDLLAYLTKQTLEPNGYFGQPETKSMPKRCEGLFAERGVSILLKEEGGANAPP
jgi:hypothetical protein